MKIHPNLPDHEYHATQRISASLLKRVHNDGPAQASAYLDGYRPISAEARDVGTWTHCAVLEPERFDAEFARAFNPDSVSTEGMIEDSTAALKQACKDRDLPVSGTKAALTDRIREADPSAQFASEAAEKAASQYGLETAGRAWIPCATYDQILAMRDAVRAHEYAGALLSAVDRTEFSIIGEDRKCRVDAMTGRMLWDLKTHRGGYSLDKTIWNTGLDIQAAWYVDMCEAAGLDVEQRFAFVFVDKREPHTVGVRVLDEEALRYGRARYEKALATWRDWCENHRTQRITHGDGVALSPAPGWVRASVSLSDF